MRLGTCPTMLGKNTLAHQVYGRAEKSLERHWRTATNSTWTYREIMEKKGLRHIRAPLRTALVELIELRVIPGSLPVSSTPNFNRSRTLLIRSLKGLIAACLAHQD